MTGHNLRHTARIVALGALLVLLQACGGGGGGGGGGSSMTECMTGQVRDSGDNECRAPETDAECMELNTMTPVLVGGACRAECGEGQTRNMTTHACETSMPMPVTCTAPTPFSHGDDCFAECPPAAPIPNSSNECMTAMSHEECRMANSAMPIRNTDGSCEAAISAAQCMNEHSLMFFHNGACSAACPDAAPIPNTSNVCEAASRQGDCPPDRQFFLSGACSAACPDAAQVSHNSVCMEMCPDAAPIPNTSNVCEAASRQGDCPPDRQFFLSGACSAACPDAAQVSHNSVCMEMCPDAAPIPNTSNVCEAASRQGDCPPDRQFFLSGACSVECPDEAPEDTNRACRLRVAGDCTDPTLPVFVDGTSPCREIRTSADCASVSPTMPAFVSGGTCRARVQVECRGTTPILTDGACGAATGNEQCETRDATLPIHVSSGNNAGSCRAAAGDSECGTGRKAENGACVVAAATACGDGQTRIEGTDVTCTSPGLTRAVTEGIPPVDTLNYNALAEVSEINVGITRDSNRNNLVTSITHGRNANSSGTTADEVRVPEGDERFTGLTIMRDDNSDGTPDGDGVMWTVNDATQRTPAPTPADDSTDRRARTDKLSWDYPTISLNAPDLLDNEADDDSNSNDDENLLNVRAAVVEWANTTDDGYYMAGGVWGYDLNDDPRDGDSEIVGAFAGGDFTNLNDNPLPGANTATSPDATYRGHSFGTYATIPAAEGDDGNRGFFAAEAEIRVDFNGRNSASVEGEINNFLFSGRGSVADKLGFTAAGQSLLENALTVEVTLESDTRSGNRFRGNINSGSNTNSTAFLNLDGTTNDKTVQLRGEWGGSFFGQGSGTGSNTVAPPGFGGTWAAAGVSTTTDEMSVTTTDTPGTNGFGISFIGSFGAKR